MDFFVLSCLKLAFALADLLVSKRQGPLLLAASRVRSGGAAKNELSASDISLGSAVYQNEH